jgi:hypothetical protein
VDQIRLTAVASGSPNDEFITDGSGLGARPEGTRSDNGVSK